MTDDLSQPSAADEARPVPRPARSASPTAPSGPVGSTVDCCPDAVAFSFAPRQGVSTYGFDSLSNKGAVPADDYWDPPEKAKALKDRETRDGAAWVSVPVDGETTVLMNLMGCASAASCTYEVVPSNVAAVVDPKPSGSMGALTIRGQAEGEASLKVMCRGKLVGYFHIWCRKMVTISVGLGAIHVTSALHKDPSTDAPMATAPFNLTGQVVSDLKAKVNAYYRQALIQFDIRLLGTFNADVVPDRQKLEAQLLVMDGPNAIFSGTGLPNASLLTSEEGGNRWIASLLRLGDLAKVRLGDYGSKTIWVLPQPDQSFIDIGGVAPTIPGPHVFVFDLTSDFSVITAHELGHALGLYHPVDIEDIHKDQYPDHLRLLVPPAPHHIYHPDDPSNLMGNNLPDISDLLYRQWKALPRS